jgi:hypothetical protein
MAGPTSINYFDIDSPSLLAPSLTEHFFSYPSFANKSCIIFVNSLCLIVVPSSITFYIYFMNLDKKYVETFDDFFILLIY